MLFEKQVEVTSGIVLITFEMSAVRHFWRIMRKLYV